MRGISTVVDATVFLLLVSGAVATLVAGTGGVSGVDERSAPGNPAAERIRLLSTSTVTVNYSLSPATRSSTDGVTFHRTSGVGFERTAHGTLASLLADAAVGNATIDGVQFSRAGDEFERAVAGAVRDRLGPEAVRTRVDVTWAPYPGSPVHGAVRVGRRPPRDVDVHAATVRVATEVPGSRDTVRRAVVGDGDDGAATALAESIVRGLFPPAETRLALRGDYPVDALTVQRYRRIADLLGVHLPGNERIDVTDANERLATALAGRLETDLTGTHDSSTAVPGVRTGTLEIAVRTWST